MTKYISIVTTLTGIVVFCVIGFMQVNPNAFTTPKHNQRLASLNNLSFPRPIKPAKEIIVPEVIISSRIRDVGVAKVSQKKTHEMKPTNCYGHILEQGGRPGHSVVLVCDMR